MAQVINLRPEALQRPISDSTTLDKLVAAAIEAIGQPNFTVAIAALCEGASGYNSTFICAYFHDHSPVELFDNLDAEQFSATVTPFSAQS